MGCVCTYVHTYEYYLVIKRRNCAICDTIQESRGIVLVKIWQKHYCSFVESEKVKLIEAES